MIDDGDVDDDDGNELALPAASGIIIMIQSKMKLLPSPLNSKKPCCLSRTLLPGPFYSRCKVGELDGNEWDEHAQKRPGVYFRYSNTKFHKYFR